MLFEVVPPAAVFLAYDTCVAVGYLKFDLHWLSIPHVPLAIFGGAIGAIVAFRNNSSYARWWEARTLWGQIVNHSRNLARQTLSIPRSARYDDRTISEIQRTQRRIILLQIAYVHALRCQLRGLPPWGDLKGLELIDELQDVRLYRNLALHLQRRIADLLSECLQHGWIDSVIWAAMDRTLSDLLSAQGGVERIKNTPLPKQYDVFPRLFILAYCLLLPLGMVASLKLFTPLGSTLVGLIFLLLDEIGRDLENPFENTVHDIPLNAISRTIEIDLKQLLREPNVPEPEKAIHGVLW